MLIGHMKHCTKLTKTKGVKINLNQHVSLFSQKTCHGCGGPSFRECLALNGIAKNWNRIAIPTN
jgi:hypothetical protein